jgi:hypothetical protein
MLSSKFRFIWLRALRGEDFFLNRSFRNNNFLWRLCFLKDHDKIGNLYRCFLQSFSSFGQAISENVFRTEPIRNTYCLWRQCLWTDRMDMCTGNYCYWLVDLKKNLIIWNPCPNEPKILYKDWIFWSDPIITMVTTCILFFDWSISKTVLLL